MAAFVVYTLSHQPAAQTGGATVGQVLQRHIPDLNTA